MTQESGEVARRKPRNTGDLGTREGLAQMFAHELKRAPNTTILVGAGRPLECLLRLGYQSAIRGYQSADGTSGFGRAFHLGVELVERSVIERSVRQEWPHQALEA